MSVFRSHGGLLYVHELATGVGDAFIRRGGGGAARSTISNERSCVEPCIGIGRPGFVPFVSDRPGAYGHLLLTVCMRWSTGMLVPSDWLRPVTRVGWRTGFPESVRGSADVS